LADVLLFQQPAWTTYLYPENRFVYSIEESE